MLGFAWYKNPAYVKMRQILTAVLSVRMMRIRLPRNDSELEVRSGLFHGSVAVLAAMAVAGAGCRTAAPRSIDAELAACLPADTVVLAGIHLDQLRANATFQKLASGWAPLLEPFRDASEVLLAYNGKDLLVAAHGAFRTAPPGATLLSNRLALSGSDGAVRAATLQHATGRGGAPALVAHAQAVASQQVWAMVRGGFSLPLSGNAANMNRLLGFTDYAALAVSLDSSVALRAAGICRSADAAVQLEETLRGIQSLAGAEERNRDLAALIASVQIRRDDRVVHADLIASPEAAENLLREAVH